MGKFTNPRDLNATSDSWATPIAKAVEIASISSRMDIEVAPHFRCPSCKSQIITRSSISNDLLDLNGKRHFCDSADRIRHEEKCVIDIHQIIEYCNRHELSSFQLGLKVDE